jgi:hypothetical protein
MTRVRGDACEKFFAAATPAGGPAPTDTLTAAQNIARNPSHQAQQLSVCSTSFIPSRPENFGATCRSSLI